MDTSEIRAAILGFGPVGQGIYNICHEKPEKLKIVSEGRPVRVVKVLVTSVTRSNRVLPAGMDSSLLTDSIEEIWAAAPHVVFEATVGEEPAFTYLHTALTRHHCSVITANKVMFAKHAGELFQCAREVRASTGIYVDVGYEATVGGGVPIVKTIENMARVQHITKVEGILNGTTNFVLTEMYQHPEKNFAEVLADAKRLGYAEADPTNDVSGMDAFKKLMVLSTVITGTQPPWAEVPLIGIEGITAAQVAAAGERGQRYRHVARLEVLPGRGEEPLHVRCSVRPELVDATHPLYSADGPLAAVAITTDYLGTVSIAGPGAGMYPTASVMVEDYLCMLAARRRCHTECSTGTS